MLRSFLLKPINFLILLTLLTPWLLVSCATDRQIRTLKEAHEAFRPNDYTVINPLLDAVVAINRDVQMSALSSLDQYVIRLLDKIEWLNEQKENAKDPKLKVSLEAESQKLSGYLATIQRQLQRLFALSSDFNVKNLCLVTLARVPTQETVDFLTTALNEPDSTVIEQALKELRPFLMDAEHFNMNASLQPTLSLFSKSDYPVFNVALSNLLLYPVTPIITSAFSSYRSLTTDASKSALLDALDLTKGNK